MRRVAALALGLLGATPALAELTRCETSIRGEALSFVYDAENPALKASLSRKARWVGEWGRVSCPGLVTLRALTPELDDSQRGPFCLQWDRTAKTYLGFAEGRRDAELTCKRPGRSICERVNGVRDLTLGLGSTREALGALTGVPVEEHSSGALIYKVAGQALRERLLALGATALTGASAPVALATAVGVGSAVYVCSEVGAGGAAVAPAPITVPDGALLGALPLVAEPQLMGLPPDEPILTLPLPDGN